MGSCASQLRSKSAAVAEEGDKPAPAEGAGAADAGMSPLMIAQFLADPERCDESVQTFKAFTGDIHNMARWLAECGIKTVAMESTGVYWVPVYQILEEHGFNVVLSNARDTRAVPGRKTDVGDAQWIQRLHACGLLKASFRPDQDVSRKTLQVSASQNSDVMLRQRIALSLQSLPSL